MNLSVSKIKFFKRKIKEMKFDIDVPWRREKDPVKILIGELLLIRTKYKQAAKVYTEFFERFPEGKVPPSGYGEALDILRKAGLKKRAEMILRALEYIQEHPEVISSSDINTLKKIPSVGDYVASAVLFFSGKGDYLYPDSNIIRVFSRFFCMEKKDPTHPSGDHIKMMKILLENFGKKTDKRRFAVNLLDFSLFICKSKPECNVCPLKEKCCFFNGEIC